MILILRYDLFVGVINFSMTIVGSYQKHTAEASYMQEFTAMMSSGKLC